MKECLLKIFVIFFYALTFLITIKVIIERKANVLEKNLLLISYLSIIITALIIFISNVNNKIKIYKACKEYEEGFLYLQYADKERYKLYFSSTIDKEKISKYSLQIEEFANLMIKKGEQYLFDLQLTKKQRDMLLKNITEIKKIKDKQ